MTLALGPQPDWLASHNGCTYNAQPERSPQGDCGRPATLHVRLRSDNGMVAACTEHKRFALTGLPVLDWHEWGAWCNLPGALWYPSLRPDEGGSWCSLDDSGGVPSRARMAEVTT